MTRAPHLAMGDGAEFDAIRRLLATWDTAAVGVGDDAAVLDLPAGERLVVSTDATMEHVHFRREWMTPHEIGARAAAAALSDLAAMAAAPRGMLIALALPDAWRAELEPLARGVGAVAAAAGCPIVGGNITSARDLSLTITVLGSAARPLSRAGACAGDSVFVTGRLGGAGAALHALLAGRQPLAEHRTRFVAPVPRLREALWLAARGARAAIDVSDGLLADAEHLARASGVSLVLDDASIPTLAGIAVRDAIRSGEEYELLMTAPASADWDTEEFSGAFGIPLTAIGTVVPQGVTPVILGDSAAGVSGGHDHLKP